MKPCSRCRVEKPLSSFHRAKNRPLGVHPQCKDCRSDLGREERERNEASRVAARRLQAQGKKRCCACGEIKALDEFHARNSGERDKQKSECKPCYAQRGMVYRATPGAKAAARASLERRRTSDPEAFRRAARAATFRSKYGIGLEEYGALLEQQEGRCAICFGLPLPEEPLFVDHDHVTGNVRGLLCRHCNTGLGMFNDDTGSLQSAIRYLVEHAPAPIAEHADSP